MPAGVIYSTFCVFKIVVWSVRTFVCWWWHRFCGIWNLWAMSTLSVEWGLEYFYVRGCRMSRSSSQGVKFVTVVAIWTDCIFSGEFCSWNNNRQVLRFYLEVYRFHTSLYYIATKMRVRWCKFDAGMSRSVEDLLSAHYYWIYIFIYNHELYLRITRKRISELHPRHWPPRYGLSTHTHTYRISPERQTKICRSTTNWLSCSGRSSILWGPRSTT